MQNSGLKISSKETTVETMKEMGAQCLLLQWNADKLDVNIICSWSPSALVKYSAHIVSNRRISTHSLPVLKFG
jgi:hypothetical protein